MDQGSESASRGRAGFLSAAGSLATILLLIAPGAASGPRVAGPVYQTAPYAGFVVSKNVTAASGPAVCAATHLRVPPHFNATSGLATFWAGTNVSTTCAGWATGSSFGPNSTSAALSLNLTLNRPLNASAALGPNVSTGTVTVIEDWKISAGVSERFYHVIGHCSEPFRTSYFYGCQGWSSFALLFELSVWDNTTHSTVPASGTSTTSWGTVGYKIWCTTSGSYCSEHEGNYSGNQSISFPFKFVGKLNSTHQYSLVATFTVYLSVYLLGWRGAGEARVNMATHGHGAVLTYLSIS
jgi:hypothetical protein